MGFNLGLAPVEGMIVGLVVSLGLVPVEGTVVGLGVTFGLAHVEGGSALPPGIGMAMTGIGFAGMAADAMAGCKPGWLATSVMAGAHGDMPTFGCNIEAAATSGRDGSWCLSGAT
mmetsp:Transcript_57658/g.95330  ORF Transcript_57658/g.95330 Transcript_57658/m.95330 type:complete len:115 (+) Transcript_57658:1075-1419(+)